MRVDAVFRILVTIGQDIFSSIFRQKYLGNCAFSSYGNNDQIQAKAQLF